jgi:hypothetical protein
MEAQRLGLWALQPPSRRAKCPKWLELSAARRGTTIALAAIESPRFSGIVSNLDLPEHALAELERVEALAVNERTIAAKVVHGNVV